MCKEVFAIVQRMNLKNIETQLALQCAPVIAGIKCANLLNLSENRVASVREALKGSEIEAEVISETKNRTMIFVYRPEALADYLLSARVRVLLGRCGYRKFRISDVISVFAARYRRYQRGESAFPHEMGALLGYPIEDVEGFIRYRGQRYLYAGYWKVYHDAPEKLRVFRLIDEEKDRMITLLDSGVSMREILAGYSGTVRKEAV